jgi:site-specific recombinase XerD
VPTFSATDTAAGSIKTSGSRSRCARAAARTFKPRFGKPIAESELVELGELGGCAVSRAGHHAPLRWQVRQPARGRGVLVVADQVADEHRDGRRDRYREHHADEAEQLVASDDREQRAGYFLDRDDIRALFDRIPSESSVADRDRARLLFLYNTGARVQEAADLRVEHLELARARFRLHGKGDKWRTCPLWRETVDRLQGLLHSDAGSDRSDGPVFRSQRGGSLTRFGIYKIVRRYGGHLDADALSRGRRVTPHVLRHTTAVHLLEAGVEVNVIRGWLGHVSLDTTNRYAEINIRTKEAALRAASPPVVGGGFSRKPPWRTDASLMTWLESL